MALAEFPSIQGRFPSWASASFKLAGKNHTGITALKWESSLAPTKVYATGARAKGGTRGKHDVTASCKMLLPDWQAFRQALAAKHPNRSYGLVEFEINAAWRETDLDKVQTANLHRCRVTKAAQDNAEGADPTQVDIELFVLSVDEDGDEIISPVDG